MPKTSSICCCCFFSMALPIAKYSGDPKTLTIAAFDLLFDAFYCCFNIILPVCVCVCKYYSPDWSSINIALVYSDVGVSVGCVVSVCFIAFCRKIRDAARVCCCCCCCFSRCCHLLWLRFSLLPLLLSEWRVGRNSWNAPMPNAFLWPNKIITALSHCLL